MNLANTKHFNKLITLKMFDYKNMGQDGKIDDKEKQYGIDILIWFFKGSFF